jgi:hypothetical protein
MCGGDNFNDFDDHVINRLMPRKALDLLTDLRLLKKSASLNAFTAVTFLSQRNTDNKQRSLTV